MRQYVTCNRRGYKLLKPSIWQVFDGLEFLGFSDNFSSNEFCNPPVYYIDPKQNYQEPLTNLPEGSTIAEEKEEEVEIEKFVEVTKYETDPKILEELEIYRSYKLKERWQVVYDWAYGHEVYWDLKSKKEAKDQLERIQTFFKGSLADSMTNIEIIKYVIGEGGEPPPSSD